MKKALFAVLFAVSVPAASFAGGKYGAAGCGMGSLAFDQNSKWKQVFAATTNGTFGTQTFGISTGTSNCSTDGAMITEREREVFVAVNFDSLNKEMAQGSGEHLAALAGMMGCASNHAEFAKMTQANYGTVFSKAETPEAMLNALDSTVSADATLSKACAL